MLAADKDADTNGRVSGQAQDQDDGNNKRYSQFSEVRSTASSDEDDSSSKGSYRSAGQGRQSQQQDRHAKGSLDEYKDNDDSHRFVEPHHGHVHFREKQDKSGVPPLTTGPRADVKDEGQEDLSRASWTTASFTEVPNALDELTRQHHPSKTAAQDDQYTGIFQEQEKNGLSVDRSSAGDLHSILVKHSQQGQRSSMSILTKYLRPTMSDEGTQAGIPSWDWLTRLEQMLIHFFLMVFESSNDSSRLIMELMSTEAGEQIEEIFQLLLKAEPDMYKELGHLVALAEKWLIHWKADSEEKQKALDYVRLYMHGVKDKNYYTLPVQVRLHKLGSFIAGLKVMGESGLPAAVPIRFPTCKPPLHPSKVPGNQFRVGSPRVKPATHFSQVVANILCGRPCDDPLPKADLYADKLGRNVFKNTLHGDKEFKTYTDKKYGGLYQKKELFSKEYPRLDSLGDGSGDTEEHLVERADCTQNLHCWIPKYTKSYVQTLKDDGCEVLAKKDFEKGIKVKEYRLGGGVGGSVGNEEVSKGIKNFKTKKLYDWVRGPDGKVHRRVVGSYTELGSAASMSRIGDPDGGGWRGAGKRGKGKGYPKAMSDSRLGTGKNSIGTKKTALTQTARRGSKGRKTQTAKDFEKSEKERFGGERKGGKNMEMEMFKMDGVSVDGSGDSGQEGTRSKRERKGSGADGKSGTKGVSNQKGKEGGANKFGASYNGPSHYKPRGTNDNNKNEGDVGVRGSDFKDKAFVNLFDKKGKGYGTQGQRTRKNFKKGHHHHRYLDDEWGGENYSDWSSGGSDYFTFDKDNDQKKQNMQLLSLNQCWEKASKLFKKPSKALVIPPADNLMLYLEKKFPKARWPRGNPIATRNYPNGSVFVSQYSNGSSKVFYPHGGLAAAVSGPSPVTSQVLLVRDPSDQMFFFDKALLAELNSSGKGVIYGDDGVIKAQYSALGGFRMDRLDKGQRWHWNQGGQRMLMKLNKYMSLRMSDQDRIFLSYFGNNRGFLVNVASGRDVSLMNPSRKTTKIDPILHELKHLIRPKTQEDNYDYIRGKFNVRPTLGFIDKAKHFANAAGEGWMGAFQAEPFRQENVGYYEEDRGRSNVYDFDNGLYSGGYGPSGGFVNYLDRFAERSRINPDCPVVVNAASFCGCTTK